MKIAIFIHSSNLSYCKERIYQFLDKINASGLINIVNIYICFVGEILPFNFDHINNIHTIHVSSNVNDYELPTLQYIYNFSLFNKDYYILYLHTKGVGKELNQCIEDQIEYMLYFNICKWKDCIKKMESGCLTVGVDLLESPMLHYSGNFWWAKSDYISSLPSPNDYSNLYVYPNPLNSWRHNQEFWICYKGNTNICNSMWNSNINCYERHLHLYPSEKYICLDK